MKFESRLESRNFLNFWSLLLLSYFLMMTIIWLCDIIQSFNIISHFDFNVYHPILRSWNKFFGEMTKSIMFVGNLATVYLLKVYETCKKKLPIWFLLPTQIYFYLGVKICVYLLLYIDWGLFKMSKVMCNMCFEFISDKHAHNFSQWIWKI